MNLFLVIHNLKKVKKNKTKTFIWYEVKFFWKGLCCLFCFCSAEVIDVIIFLNRNHCVWIVKLNICLFPDILVISNKKMSNTKIELTKNRTDRRVKRHFTRIPSVGYTENIACLFKDCSYESFHSFEHLLLLTLHVLS